MAAYATRAQLLERYDARVLGDLVGDADTRVSAANLLNDANLLAAIEDASGEIDAALLCGERYSTADLEGLTGNSQKYLVRVCCDIAMANLYGRRVDSAWATGREAAEKVKDSHLGRLRSGEHVFDLAPQKEAGNPSVAGPTTAQVQNLNLIVDRTTRYYPTRILPNGR